MLAKKMKKNIAFLIRDLEYGGAQRQLVTLVKEFDKRDFDLSLLYFYSDGPLLNDLKDSDISVISLNKQGRWDLLGFLGRFIWAMWKIKPHILHAYMADSNITALLLKPFFPKTRIIWGIRVSQTPSLDWLERIISKLEKFLSSFVDLIIVNSHSGKEDYANNGFPIEKMVVISNGIDTEKFKPDREAGRKIRLEWGISEDEILIGLVGRLYPEKDHPNFLRAAELLCGEHENLRFVCVGDGPDEAYKENLSQMTQELGLSKKVIWAGAHSNMCAIHNALDIAVSASASGEGFGNVIGEAMACGVTCVVTDIGDSAWIVGDTGVVVPPQNPEALAEGCKKLIVLPLEERKVLQENARRKIIEKFSVNNLVKTTQFYCLKVLRA